MKSLNTFSRLFAFAITWTVIFLGLATYATTQTLEKDPELTAKLEKQYDVSISAHGIQYGGGVTESSSDSWTVAPAKKISVSVVSGNVQIKTTTGNEVLISVTGEIDKSATPRLLDVASSDSELTIAQPRKGVKELNVQIQVPESFKNKFTFKSVSGDITAENLSVDEFNVKTVSGNIILNKISAQNFDVNTVSGNITARESSTNKIEVHTVSGDLDIENALEAQTEIKSASGNVRLKLPKSETMRFQLKTASGDINNSHGSNKDGKTTVSVSSASGDITID